MSLLGIFMVASSAHAYVSGETSSVARSMGAVTFSEVKFNSGDMNLTDDQKKDIAQAVSTARQKGEVEKVKVLAWSDKEYPQREVKYAKSDVDLASNRLDQISSYLKDSLDIGTVHTFNMAERPNKLQKMLDTKDAKVKARTEAEGAAPSTSEETGIFGLKGQSSKALVLIFLKK